MIPRYLVSEINKIFLDNNKYEKWLLIEKLVLKFLSNKGYFSKDTYEKLINQLDVNYLDIAAEEAKTKHDFVAFINVISRKVTIPEKKWIHYGLTTTDVVDTANALMIREVNELLLYKIKELQKKLKEIAYKYKDLPQIGRTHGIHAELTSFGYKFAIFHHDLENSLELFHLVRKNIECAMISGSVGTFANTTPELQRFIAEELKLNSCNASTQVLSRERYANYFYTLNILGQTINKISCNLRDLSRTEINEINEFFDDSQVGSSSMPHKKNPIALENISGLSRLLNGYALSSISNIPLWNERDISHSSVERVLLLDATTILWYIIDKLTAVLLKMSVNEESIKKNIELTRGNIFSQTAMLKILPKSNLSREQLHHEIKKISFAAEKNKSSFEEELKKHELSSLLTEKEIKQIFDPEYHLRYIDDIYKMIFKNHEIEEKFETIIYEKDKIMETIDLLANQINHYYQDSKEEIVLLSCMDGAVVFTGQLLPKLNFLVRFMSAKTSLYGNNVNIVKKEIEPIEGLSQLKGKRVLILDDLLDTGETIAQVKKELIKVGAKEIKVCVLFKKDLKEQISVVDWCGLIIPDKWVAGFGLDSKKKYRNIDFLGVLKSEFY